MRRVAAVFLSLSLAAPLRAAELVEPAAELPSAAATPVAPVVPGSLAVPALTPMTGLLPAAEANLPAPASAEAPKAHAVLSAVAGAKEAAPAQAAAYDGLKAPSAPAGPEFSPVAAPAPAAKQPSFLRRLNRATDSRTRAERWFERAVPLGIAAAVAAPVLWKASSPGTMLYSAPIALTTMLLIFSAVSFYRAARFLVLRRDPREGRKERSRLAATLAGLALGAALGVAPKVFEPRLVVFGAREAAPAAQVQAVQGDALRDAVIDRLSQNPEGRDVLDGLRDRGGVIRMPRFYVSNSKDAIAQYNGTLDAVFITRNEVTSKGTTVDDFLRDPARQRAFAQTFETTFAHELRHNNQARRSLASALDFKDSPESEAEAYITEVRFTHARLKADPHAELGSGQFGQYLLALDGFDPFLKSMTSSYKDPHENTAYYREFLRKARAEWPSFMVEGNLLLARRDAAHPKMAARYIEAARKIAAANHLPDPRP